MKHILSALLAISVFCAAASEQRPELRIYDVTEFTTGIRPVFGCCTVNPGPDVPHLAEFTTASLMEMIRVRVQPESWDPAKGTSIEEKGSLLVVMQVADVQEEITQLLSRYRSLCQPQVVVKGVLLASNEIPADSILDQDSFTKLLGAKGMAGALAAPRLACFNKQHATVLCGREFNSVSNYAPDGELLAPTIATYVEGAILEVRPLLIDDARLASVELRFTLNTAADNSEKNKLFPGNAGAKQNVSGEKLAATNPLEVDATSMNISRIRTNVRAPVGSWALAGTLPNPDTAAAEKNLLFFVNVEPLDKSIIGKPNGPDPEPSTVKKTPPKTARAEPVKEAGAPQLRIFDVRDIAHMFYDSPGRKMTLRGTEKRDVEAEPRFGFVDTDLGSIIKEKLMAEDFADPQFTVDVAQEKLVVYQRAKVQEAIAAWLNEVRRKYVPQIAVKAMLVSAADAPAETLFDEQSLKRILAAKGNVVVASPSFVCTNKQLSHVCSGRDIGYVSTIDTTDDNYMPTMAAILDGCQLEARPILGFDGTQILLELQFALNSDVARNKRTLGLSRGASGEIDLVSMNTNQVQTQVAVPTGKWVLAASFSNGNAKAPRNLLLFVSAEPMKKP
jgi:hypothetical protein